MEGSNNLVVIFIDGVLVKVSREEFEAIKAEEKRNKWLEDMMSDPN